MKSKSCLLPRLLVALSCLVPVTRTEAALVIGPWIPKFKGVDLSVSTNIPPSGGDLTHRQVVSALRVDLSDPDVQFFTTPRISGYSEGQREVASYTVSDFLKKYQVQAAINANFFSEHIYYLPAGTPMDLYGLAISQGVVVSPQDSRNEAATLKFTADNQVEMVSSNWPPTSTEGVYTAVSGNYPLLIAGRNVGRKFDVEPRTAFGISEDKRYLFLLAIDGRQPGYSDGSTDYESAHWLKLLGAYDGINLDGGGSTTLVLEGSTGTPIRINKSSAVADSGRERTVGSHFGIFAKPVPGFISDLTVSAEMNTATVTWSTAAPASGEVEFGITADLGSNSVSTGPDSTTHSIQLTGLLPETGYYYRVMSAAGGTQYLSAIHYFTTTNYVTTNLVLDLTNSWTWSFAPQSDLTWATKDFDDSTWSGPDPGLLWVDTRATPNPDVQPRNTQMPVNEETGDPYVTYYFRTHLDLAAMQPGSALLFSGYVDDGAVFYLNGAEIYRLRVPEGATASTVASGFPCDGNADCLDEFKLPVDALSTRLDGDNVLAVEVHNYNVRSGDITFGFALSRIDPIQTSVEMSISIVGNQVELRWDGAGGILETAPSANGPWSETQSSSGSQVMIEPTAAQQFYRIRK